MSVDNGFEEFKRRVRQGVEEEVGRYFARCPDTEVSRVAKYVALGGGHRWRAMAVIAAGRVLQAGAYEICVPSACGVELAHAASLLLDDLPSMDDARVRRGRPCAHLLFPRWAVDLAPAFLVSMAYGVALQNPLATAERQIAAALELARAAFDMLNGQEQDLERQIRGPETAEEEPRRPRQLDLERLIRRRDPKSLLECYRLKSGALYAASTKAGALLCGASDEEAGLLYGCGMDLGVSYQLLDDIADVTGGTREMGKEAGMDAGKLTAVDFFGVNGAKAQAGEFAGRALARLEGFGRDAEMLRCLIRHAKVTAAAAS